MKVFANRFADAVRVLGFELLPDGVSVVTVPCIDGQAFCRLPDAISFDDKCYGKSGWNSDRNIAYYRTDIQVAWKQN